MLRRLVLMLAFGALSFVPHAQAAAVLGGIGPRVGFSSNPDQLVLGGQAIIGELAPDLTFDPSLEFGFGDHSTVIAANFDLHYHFVLTGSAWRPYAGAGIGLNFIEVDEGFAADRSDTEVGGNLILGAGVPTRSGNRFFSELKLGLGDVPELKLLVGWNFKI
ncbi:MAG: hypothetical protein E6K80_12050 [Candidatus Eisenbacteria bacterium]|uniref:Outer membrane protein beta-barrel domain-containing protein n=1 Tax=Eiseniibacteriota bacterium TaxID=2212470 RepID=A0A538U099_UNCEI|nr:MAG: hypothetical protein E6K80_12050 [Candidatus Eisenbacteria bacterium]